MLIEKFRLADTIQPQDVLKIVNYITPFESVYLVDVYEESNLVQIMHDGKYSRKYFAQLLASIGYFEYSVNQKPIHIRAKLYINSFLTQLNARMIPVH